MAEHVVRSFSCDRCGADLGAARGRQPTQVTAQEEGEWAMDWAVKWRDLCEPCRADVRAFFTTGVRR